MLDKHVQQVDSPYAFPTALSIESDHGCGERVLFLSPCQNIHPNPCLIPPGFYVEFSKQIKTGYAASVVRTLATPSVTLSCQRYIQRTEQLPRAPRARTKQGCVSRLFVHSFQAVFFLPNAEWL